MDFDPNKLKIGDMVGRERIIWQDDEDIRIDLVRDGDNIRIETYYKTVQSVLDENSRAAAEWSKTRTLTNLERVAGIPTGLYYEWKKEGIIDDPERLKRRLNDSDFSKVRVNRMHI